MLNSTGDRVVAIIAAIATVIAAALSYLQFNDPTNRQILGKLDEIVDGSLENLSDSDLVEADEFINKAKQGVLSEAKQRNLKLPMMRINEGYTKLSPTNAVHLRLPNGQSTSITMYQLSRESFRVTIPNSNANFVRSGSRVELTDSGCSILFGEYNREEKWTNVGLDCKN